MHKKIFLSLFLMSGFSALGATPEENSAIFSFWTLMPPLVAIALAFITKNVILSLFIGIFSGTFLLNLAGKNIFQTFLFGFLDIVQRALNSLADKWNAGIVLQVLAIGGLIALVSRMGGAKAIAESLAKRAKTPLSAQIVTWFLGLVIFFGSMSSMVGLRNSMHD